MASQFCGKKDGAMDPRTALDGAEWFQRGVSAPSR
jgi:hypothetical protein